MAHEQCRELTNRLIGTEKKWMVARGKASRGGWGENGEGEQRYKPLVIKKINHGM